jgi:hypothetical protein
LGIIKYRQTVRHQRKLRFTASYYWRRFMKPGLIKPVFPPVQKAPSAETECESIRLSLWREQRVMLSRVVYALLTSFRLMFSAHIFQRLPCACADSKRQRVPTQFRPLHPIPK